MQHSEHAVKDLIEGRVWACVCVREYVVDMDHFEL